MSYWIVGVRHRQTPELAQEGLLSEVHPDGDTIWYLRKSGNWGTLKQNLRQFESEELAQAQAFASMLQWPETIFAYVVEKIE